MNPRGALIFNAEQALFHVNVNYAEAYEIIGNQETEPAGAVRPPGIGPRLLALKGKMKRQAYLKTRSKAESVAAKLETQALASARLMPGAVTAVDAARREGWWVVVASDYAKKAVLEGLESKSLRSNVDQILARSHLDEERNLARRLQPLSRKMKGLGSSVYFCNSSLEIKAAKSLGMKCFALPSPVEQFRWLLQAEPDGIILSLDELPQLLSLPSMKLPAEANPETGQIDSTSPRPAPTDSARRTRE